MASYMVKRAHRKRVSQRVALLGSSIGGIVNPTDAQGTRMAGTDGPASPVDGGAGGAAIGRDIADRQRLRLIRIIERVSPFSPPAKPEMNSRAETKVSLLCGQQPPVGAR
jgi:hypothetical protein